MSSSRIALGLAGGLLMTFGIFRLLTDLDPGDLVVLGIWLVVALALHDGVVAPLTAGVGVTLTRVAPRARRYLQGGLIVAAMVTVIALPLINREGTQPAAESILMRDYAANLALLLALVAAVAAVLYVARVIRDRGD